jgi:hypothetical protein
MDLLVAGAGGSSFAWITGEPVRNTVEPGELFVLDMDHVSRLHPLVSLHRRSLLLFEKALPTQKHFALGVEVPQSVQPQAPHLPGKGADRRQQQPDDPSEAAALVFEFHGLLLLLRIESPPLAAANAALIRQCRWSIRAKACQPLAGGAFTDAVLSSQLSKASALVEMLTDQAFTIDRCQADSGVWMHGV